MERPDEEEIGGHRGGIIQENAAMSSVPSRKPALRNNRARSATFWLDPGPVCGFLEQVVAPTSSFVPGAAGERGPSDVGRISCSRRCASGVEPLPSFPTNLAFWPVGIHNGSLVTHALGKGSSLSTHHSSQPQYSRGPQHQACGIGLVRECIGVTASRSRYRCRE